MMKAASFVDAAFVIHHVLFCLLGVEATSFLCGARWTYARPAAEIKTKGCRSLLFQSAWREVQGR
jgi:hypothetical protein